MDGLEAFYNKFNEEKRLLRPCGQIEYRTTMKYIHDFIGGRKEASVLDVGCATGRYALPLAAEGFSITAVDPVNYHLGILRQKAERMGVQVTAKRGNALDLKKYPADHYDIILYLGPLYHLFTEEDKVRALKEAGRVLKPGGYLFVSYCMNEYGVLIHGFREGAVKTSLDSGKLGTEFAIRNTEEDIFSFDRLEDIERYNIKAGLKRMKIISQDGPANYMRELINSMDEETQELFYRYHLSTCERPDLLGAGCHTLDILTKD